MLQNDSAVFHAFAWNPVEAEYDDWRGMGTRPAIAARSFEAQGPVHYCPKE
jgi:hypothetical protein